MLETRKKQKIAFALFRNKWLFSLVCNYAYFFIGVQMKSPFIEKEICILLLQPNW